MTHWLRIGSQAGAFAVLVLLGACGGDDPVANTAETPSEDSAAVPATATASAQAFVGFLGELSQSTETALPADVGSPRRVDDESSEPVDL